jgi:hypothetical protein
MVRSTWAVGLVGLPFLTQLPSSAWAQGAPPPTPRESSATAPASAPAAQTGTTPATAGPTESAAPASAAEAGNASSASASAPLAPADPNPATVAPTAGGTQSVDTLALERELAQDPSATDDYKLDLYGFADFTYGQSIKKFVFGRPNDSFAVGNLNLYLASSLGDSWKTLAEVRFTYLPHGSTPVDPTGQSKRVDTTSNDYNDLNRPVRPGGVIIERAYLEYQAHPLLNIRAGHFLTPYGIWNVDHGSPVIIGARRPFVVGAELLPESQTGLEIYGTYLLEPFLVGYHLTLSNGRGPIDTYQDLNSNKALGGRLYAHADTSAGGFTLGVSGYTGRYTDKTDQFTIDAAGKLSVAHPITADYKEASLAADVKWELGGFLVQSEAIMNDVVYQGHRPVDTFAFEGPPGFVPDYRRIGVYGLTGYRFAFGGIMPFGGLEYYSVGNNGPFGESAAFWGGVNVRPTPRVVLKAQYTYSWIPGTHPEIPEGAHYNGIDFQAAWSF